MVAMNGAAREPSRIGEGYASNRYRWSPQHQTTRHSEGDAMDDAAHELSGVLLESASRPGSVILAALMPSSSERLGEAKRVRERLKLTYRDGVLAPIRLVSGGTPARLQAGHI
jgi:hypothetical protein